MLEWQQRPLDPCYPIVYLDALYYKIREDGKIKTKAIYVVLGITVEGERDVLGLYQGFGSEGACEWSLDKGLFKQLFLVLTYHETLDTLQRIPIFGK